ncbi:MAG: lipid II flippase MurJ [Rickettsiales bacterium]
MKNIKKASFIIILTTIISRITGFIKEILIANYFGTSVLADIIIIATRLPNLFRRIFGEGAMSQVFIPIYCTLEQLSKKIFLHKIFILLFLSTSIISLLLSLFMGDLFFFIAPGIIESHIKDLAILSSQISVFYLIFICLTSLFGAVLNSEQKFFAFGIMPIIPNITIAILLIFTSYFHIQKENLVILININFLVSGILQLIFIIFSAKKHNIEINIKIIKNFFLIHKQQNNLNINLDQQTKINKQDKFQNIVIYQKNIISKFQILDIFSNLYKKLKTNYNLVKKSLFFDLTMQNFFKNFIIVSFSNLSMQINIFIAQAIASLVEGCIAILSYADRIYQLPISIISVTLNTILLPIFSNKQSSIENKNNILIGIVIISAPIMFGLSVISNLVTSFIYQRGAFSITDTIKTSESLSYFAYSLLGFVLMRVIFSMFYADQNTKAPAFINIYYIVINTIINYILIDKFEHLAAPISNIISTYTALIYLIIAANKKLYIKITYQFLFNLTRCIFAALLMYYILLYLIKKYLIFIMETKIIILISIFTIIIIGFIVYFLTLILIWPQVLKFIKK